MPRILALSLACALAIAAGAAAIAQEHSPAPVPGATELPFVNQGANQPVLQPLSPDGLPLEAELAQGAGIEPGHEGKKGLPQFDTSTFARQLFWLALVFAFMYVFFARKTLPSISSVLEHRRERIDSDIRAAESVKKEIERVRSEYEAAIASARSEAQNLMAGIHADIKRTLEARDGEFKDRADQAVDALERKIEHNRARVVSELNDLAATLAVDITNRVAGIKADATAARSIVDAQNQKARAA